MLLFLADVLGKNIYMHEVQYCYFPNHALCTAVKRFSSSRFQLKSSQACGNCNLSVSDIKCGVVIIYVVVIDIFVKELHPWVTGFSV